MKQQRRHPEPRLFSHFSYCYATVGFPAFEGCCQHPLPSLPISPYFIHACLLLIYRLPVAVTLALATP